MEAIPKKAILSNKVHQMANDLLAEFEECRRGIFLVSELEKLTASSVSSVSNVSNVNRTLEG